jgi:hypothetical protein
MPHGERKTINPNNTRARTLRGGRRVPNLGKQRVRKPVARKRPAASSGGGSRPFFGGLGSRVRKVQRGVGSRVGPQVRSSQRDAQRAGSGIRRAVSGLNRAESAIRNRPTTRRR